MNPRRFVTARLWSSPRRSLGEVVRHQARSYDRAQLLVRAFYAVSFFWVINRMSQWPTLLRVDTAEPQWPAFWLDDVGLDRGIRVLLVGYALAAAAVLAFPQRRLLRFAYFVMLLQFLALSFGFGKINHDFHAWLYTSAVFVFLPDGGWDRPKRFLERHDFLSVFWAAQVVILFTYTLTGLWKVAYAVRALTTSAVSAFELDGFSYIVADRLLVTNQDTVLGEWFVRNPVPGWLLFNGTIYLEAVSLLIAFRPRLHRLWGFGLLMFHLGTQLAMGFSFGPAIILIGLLFVCSPFAPDRVTPREALADLPGVRLVGRLLAARRRSQEVGAERGEPVPALAGPALADPVPGVPTVERSRAEHGP